MHEQDERSIAILQPDAFLGNHGAHSTEQSLFGAALVTGVTDALQYVTAE